MQTASQCESPAKTKCRDISMHWWMIRIDTDFRFKNTDSPHKIVACLCVGIMAGQKPPDKTLYPYNTQITQCSA